MRINVARDIVLLLGLAIGCTTNDDAKSSEGRTATTNHKEQTMNDTKTKQIWNAYIVYDDDDDKFAGQLALENGMLSVVSSESNEDKEYLEGVVEDINALDHLVDLAPPKEPDAPRYALGADVYDRDHPDFEKVLVRKLLENHSLKVKESK